MFFLLILMIQDLLDISNGDEETLILDGCNVSSSAYIWFKIIQQSFVLGALIFYRVFLFKHSFVKMTILAMVVYRFLNLQILWLVYNDGDNVLYHPTSCMVYYGSLNIAYESVNKFKDSAKEVIEMMLTGIIVKSQKALRLSDSTTTGVTSILHHFPK